MNNLEYTKIQYPGVRVCIADTGRIDRGQTLRQGAVGGGYHHGA